MSTDLRTLLADSVTGLFSGGRGGAELMSQALAEGWDHGLTDDPAAVETLFAFQGRHITPRSPLLDLVVLSALQEAGGAEDLPCAPATTAVLYPVARAQGAAANLAPGSSSETVTGLVLSGAERATYILAPVVVDGDLTLGSFLMADSGHTSTSISGVDPTLGLGSMTLQGPPVAIAPTGTSWWQHAVLAGRRAVAYELHSLARSMLDLTIGYAEQRHQFGRPIGSFQAVRHQLAEVFVAVESAGLALGESWEQPDPWQVALTKSLAGAAHALASNTCLQVHGAIGFTAEYDLHRFIRRGWVLDLILGSTRELDAAAGLAILESHTVPRVGSLVDSHV